MSFESLLPLLLFAFVSSITPGPNNFMLLASGVNFGVWRTLPHMCGIAAGFGLLILCVGAGLGGLIAAFPAAHLVMKVLGAAYLLYLAYRISMSRSVGSVPGSGERSSKGASKGSGEGKERPMSFLEAAVFQWVNPKAWTMGLTAVALYTDPAFPVLSLLAVVGAFVVINFPSVGVWTLFGTLLRRFLSDPVRLRWFNIAMGALLALTVIPMLL